MLECRYSGMCDTEMRDGECDGCGNFKHPDWLQYCIGYEPMPDAGALLELAGEIEYGASSDDGEYHDLPAIMVAAVARKQMEYVRRIREACGEVVR